MGLIILSKLNPAQIDSLKFFIMDAQKNINNELLMLNKLPWSDDDTGIDQWRNSSAACMAIESIYSGYESIIKRLLMDIDHFKPSGESWHKDLLRHAVNTTDNRKCIISDGSYAECNKFRAFRHIAIHEYSTKINEKRVYFLSKDIDNFIKTMNNDLSYFMNTHFNVDLNQDDQPSMSM